MISRPLPSSDTRRSVTLPFSTRWMIRIVSVRELRTCR
jgi:hypothetical protein